MKTVNLKQISLENKEFGVEAESLL